MPETPKTTSTDTNTGTQVSDKELIGIVLSLISFWLCAQTFMNLGPLIGGELGVEPGMMNVIISLAALTTGMFIVMWGAIGDRWGRVKTNHLGNVFSIIGSLLIAFAGGSPTLAMTMLIVGRILQGMSTAAVMPAALSLINTYWEGPARGRALSVFWMGTFGGFIEGTLGWRAIFIMMVSFQLLLTQGARWGWASGATITVAVLFILSTLAFVW